MCVTADEIVLAASQLPESERMSIVNRLLETMGEDDLPSDDEADWVEEFAEEMRRRRDDTSGAAP